MRAKRLNSQTLFCVDDYVKLGADHTLCSVIMRLGVLNGVTVMGAGDTPAAVVAITGRVKNVNVIQSALAGKQADKRASIAMLS